MGIGPTQPAWKASVLPLNYTRILSFLANEYYSITDTIVCQLLFFKFNLSSHYKIALHNLIDYYTAHRLNLQDYRFFVKQIILFASVKFTALWNIKLSTLSISQSLPNS